MLIAITLILVTDKNLLLPQFVGRANYAAMLDRLNQIDPDLGAHVHGGNGPKPMTCSSLLNVRSNRQGSPIRAGEPCFLRVTGLEERTSRGLAAALLDDRPLTWELDGHVFDVRGTICDNDRDPWSSQTSYEVLAAARLLKTGPPEKKVTLQFDSPTAFKSHGKTIPVPLPGLLFGSLVERWNAFSPVTLSPEMRDYADEALAISRYELRSIPVVQKNAGLRVGGVGEVTYCALGGDRYWFGVMQMLADFAKYSGAGVQTAAGMGQCHRVG